ncbi:MAG: winged helix-turn-helix transcriptional regulator, partial [Victivallales bacterium]|nr:winged helix-turn-helix transcriptional regulator [Victivallales bacterium]
MSTDLNSETVPARGSIRTAVAEYFRERILTGTLPPGSLLPSTQELAEKYQTGAANIHHAMSTLVKEGLISRRPKIGTVVNELKQQLERVAVYIKEDLRHPQAMFLRQLLSFLEQELNGKGIECLLINENREMSGWRQLNRLAST